MNKAFKLSSIVAALLLSGMLVGCGNSSSGSNTPNPDPGPTPNPDPDPDPKPETKTAKVLVVDGVVVGATVTVKGSDKTNPPTDGKGETNVTYEKSIQNVVIMSTGGKSNDLPAPDMKAALAEGTTVVNPFTTLKQDGKDVADILGKFKVTGVTAEQATGNYTSVENASFAKATVTLGRMLYCAQQPASAVDNATTAVTGDLETAAQGATDTAAVLTSLKANAKYGVAAEQIASVADENASTVDKLEQALKTKLTTTNAYGCKAVEVTPPNPDPNPDPDPDNGSPDLPQ